MESADHQAEPTRRPKELLYLAQTALLCVWLTGWDIILLMFGIGPHGQSGMGQISACIAATGVWSWWIRIRTGEQLANSQRRGSTLLAFLVILLAMLPVDTAWTLPYHDRAIGFQAIVLSLAVLTFLSRIIVWAFWWRLVARGSGIRGGRLLFAVVLGVSVMVVGIAFLRTLSQPLIDPSFATKATLRFHYGDKNIDTKMSDRDLKTLREMLRGRAYKDMPSCGFGTDVSITLTDGHKSITFCPACDKCSGFQIGVSDTYINVTDEERDQFERMVAKYGMMSPCE